MGLGAREHLLQMVDALPHNLDILQAILGGLGPPEGKDGGTPLQPPHMHLSHRSVITRVAQCSTAFCIAEEHQFTVSLVR